MCSIQNCAISLQMLNRDMQECAMFYRLSNVPLATSLSPIYLLLQLVKDMVGVGESTNWATRSSAEAKYRALRCEVELLDPVSLEYADIRDHIFNSQDE